jgi:hypothetical protein
MSGRILAIFAVAGGLSILGSAAFGHVMTQAAGADAFHAATAVEKVQYVRRAPRAYYPARRAYRARGVVIYPSGYLNGGGYYYYPATAVGAPPVVVKAPVVAAPLFAPAPVIAAPVVAAPPAP